MAHTQPTNESKTMTINNNLNNKTFRGEFYSENGTYVGKLFKVGKDQFVIADPKEFGRSGQFNWVSAPFRSRDFRKTGSTNYGYAKINEYTAAVAS